jgi:tripartite-type tricarboxylate transporter receptor subunit TctC
MNADTVFRAAKHALATLLAVLAFGATASAQDWPTKTVRIVVPFGPGSTPDVVARLVAEGLQQKYPASTFVVENKPGASGNLGTDIVAKATPDGSTLGVSIGARHQYPAVLAPALRSAQGH